MPTSATDLPSASLTEFDGSDWTMAGADGRAVRMLLVPGEQVAIHWLALADGLTQPQAAAAARLMLADASAEPLADMHVAVGRPERGLTPVALVPNALMTGWVAADHDIILPSPFLILPPEQGLVRRDARAIPDYRGPAVAFTAEPELAALLIGDAQVEPADEISLEAGLGEALEHPALNLRQGPFAKRRQWRVDKGGARRVALLALALVAASLLLQVATIMRYAFAADRLEAEAAEIAAAAPAAGDAGPGFAPIASILFDSVRAVPNVELTRIDYRPDGSLSAIVQFDSPATLAALRRHIEAGGVAVEAGAPQGGGGRPGTELVLRPA